MKHVGVAFAIAGFFVALFFYVSTLISPWDQESLDLIVESYDLSTQTELIDHIEELRDDGLLWRVFDTGNFYIWILLLGTAFVSCFSAVHMFVDKLFIKKFFEKANIPVAIRRGVLLYLLFIGSLGLRFLSGLTWYNFLALVMILFAIEYLLDHQFQGKDNSVNASNSKIENTEKL